MSGASTSTYPENLGNGGGARRPSLSFFVFFVRHARYVASHRQPRRCVYVLNLGGTDIRPQDSFSYLVIIPIFVLVLVLLLVVQQAATYSIAAVAGN